MMISMAFYQPEGLARHASRPSLKPSWHSRADGHITTSSCLDFSKAYDSLD